MFLEPFLVRVVFFYNIQEFFLFSLKYRLGKILIHIKLNLKRVFNQIETKHNHNNNDFIYLCTVKILTNELTLKRDIFICYKTVLCKFLYFFCISIYWYLT